MFQIEMSCLKESIEKKWKPIVAGTHTNLGADDCTCCNTYINSNCEGCPIYKDTGKRGCVGTPYSVFCDLGGGIISRYEIFRIFDLMIEIKAAAQWELDYLTDLLERTNLESARDSSDIRKHST